MIEKEGYRLDGSVKLENVVGSWGGHRGKIIPGRDRSGFQKNSGGVLLR